MEAMMNEKIGIVGLGFLGRGIAASFLSQGFEVVGLTPSAPEHELAMREIETMVVERKKLCGLESSVNDWKERFHRVSDFDKLADCTFVVESVPEDILTKQSVLDAVENMVQPTVVIASNTSAIPISLLQQSRKYPSRMIGMHWAEPAHMTRFLELICGDQTSPEVLDATLRMGRRLGKEPIVCQKDIPGFIVNRIAYAMYREACNLIDAGVADAESIDCSMRNSLGLWASVCGPLRWIDITGGPVLYARAMEGVLPTLSNSTIVPRVLQKLADEGASGTANGRGFYNYTSEESEMWKERYHRQVAEVMRMQDREFPLSD